MRTLARRGGGWLSALYVVVLLFATFGHQCRGGLDPHWCNAGETVVRAVVSTAPDTHPCPACEVQGTTLELPLDTVRLSLAGAAAAYPAMPPDPALTPVRETQSRGPPSA
jgi:hypothetical protein